MVGHWNAAHRRYLLRLAIAMAIYLASLFAAEWLIEDRGVRGVAAVLLALVPGLCIASVFWIFARLIVEEKDEFVRLLHVRMTLVATGLTMSVAAIWGFLEVYGLIFHLEAFWWPCLWFGGLGVGALFNRLTLGQSGSGC